MKLFGERYLGGKVEFSSAPEAGTVFQIRLPRSGPPTAAASARGIAMQDAGPHERR